MILLALKAMVADRGKLLTALVGVAFAAVLVNLQGGLYLGLIRKASLIVDQGGADIWVAHRHCSAVDVSSPIPERWITRVRGVAGVERADPLIVTYGGCALPDGRQERVVIVGSDPASLLGTAWTLVEGTPEAIRQPEGILVDVGDGAKLGHPRVGTVLEINGRRARVVGLTRGFVGFTACPYVFTTLDRARSQYSTMVPPGYCTFYLVKARPGTSVADLAARIQQRVPELDVLDRAAYSDRCQGFWMARTGIGISFGLATLLGLLVGLIIVAKTFHASVHERAREFGTLKAMGADERCIACFLITQALGQAALGSVAGLAASVVIGRGLTSPQAPVVFTGGVMAGSVALLTVICLAATWLPYRRIRRIDPAAVLRS